MKITDIAEVAQLARARENLEWQLCQVIEGCFGVMINSTYQDEGIGNAAKPMILSELRLRIHAIDVRLTELGVKIEEVADPAQPPLPLEEPTPIEHHQV